MNDLVGVYRGTPHLVYSDYTQPVYSYNQENWERIPNVKYDSASHTFQFSQHFINESEWIAYAHPYPTSRLRSVIDEIKASEFVQVEHIAKTEQGRTGILKSHHISKALSFCCYSCYPLELFIHLLLKRL